MLEFLGYGWMLVVYAILFGLFNSWLGEKLYHRRIKRNEKKFLRHLRIEHPESTVVLSSLESSDLNALKEIKEKLDALS